MKERREKRKRWVRRGKYAVEVEVDVVCPAGDPSEPCLEPATVRWLDEVARRAENRRHALQASSWPDLARSSAPGPDRTVRAMFLRDFAQNDPFPMPAKWIGSGCNEKWSQRFK